MAQKNQHVVAHKGRWVGKDGCNSRASIVRDKDGHGHSPCPPKDKK